MIFIKVFILRITMITFNDFCSKKRDTVIKKPTNQYSAVLHIEMIDSTPLRFDITYEGKPQSDVLLESHFLDFFEWYKNSKPADVFYLRSDTAIQSITKRNIYSFNIYLI